MIKFCMLFFLCCIDFMHRLCFGDQTLSDHAAVEFILFSKAVQFAIEEIAQGMDSAIESPTAVIFRFPANSIEGIDYLLLAPFDIIEKVDFDELFIVTVMQGKFLFQLCFLHFSPDKTARHLQGGLYFFQASGLELVGQEPPENHALHFGFTEHDEIDPALRGDFISAPQMPLR